MGATIVRLAGSRSTQGGRRRAHFASLGSIRTRLENPHVSIAHLEILETRRAYKSAIIAHLADLAICQEHSFFAMLVLLESIGLVLVALLATALVPTERSRTKQDPLCATRAPQVTSLALELKSARVARKEASPAHHALRYAQPAGLEPSRRMLATRLAHCVIQGAFPNKALLVAQRAQPAFTLRRQVQAFVLHVTLVDS
jgi:hypothetical protein